MDKFSEVFDWRSVLVEQYKNFGLDEQELSIILVIHAQKNKGIKFITPDLLSLNMVMSFKDVDKNFSKLIKKNLVSFQKEEEGFEVSLEPLKKKLLAIYYENINKEKKDYQTEYKKDMDDILILFESEFSRALNKTELETVESWFEKKYEINLIKEALNVAILAKAKTIRYIDKVLLEWKKREELKSDGRTTLGGKWNKDLSETIEIAGINWLDDDEE